MAHGQYEDETRLRHKAETRLRYELIRGRGTRPILELRSRGRSWSEVFTEQVSTSDIFREQS